MPLTVEKVAEKIDSFLQQASQRVMLQRIEPEIAPSQATLGLVREEFKKVIFSTQKECLESIVNLPIDLAVEAQKLRLLRIGAELDVANTTKYSKINSDCFNELLSALEFGNISENLKHKFAYV